MSKHLGASDAIDLGAIKLEVSDFASQGNAILGIRDSGKSYTATYLAEQLLARDIPFVAFDPIGIWRFLRHAGKHRKGFELIVAGGAGGDVPLDADNCVEILRHALEHRTSVVFDLYDITMSKSQWRTIVERCVRTLLYENKGRGLRHIFIEEAAEFVPQMVRGEHANVYAEIEKLARMGGNAMLGYTLINQRAEQVNKAVLELCDCLFLHRQKGRLSLTALGKWLNFGSTKDSARIIGELPMLEQGQCYVWANGKERPEFTTIPEKKTFHPNRREHTDAGQPVPVPHMLKGLELTAEPAPPARNRTNEAAAIVARVVKEAAAPPEPVIVKVPVFEAGEVAKLDLAARNLREIAQACMGAADDIVAAIAKCEMLTRRADPPRQQPPPKRTEQGQPTVLAKGPRTILGILAAKAPGRLTQTQIATLCGFTPSTYRTYMPTLRAGGMVDENSDGFTVTEAGRLIVGTDVPRIPKGGRELLDFWKTKLTQGEGSILHHLYQCGRTGTTMESLEQACDFTPSTLRTYIPTLRRNNLIEKDGLRIAPEFLQ